jgi:hypothetical protein
MTTKDAARILVRARQALLLGSFVLTAVWGWRREGLFRLFVEMETRWTGRDDPFFTLLFTFLTLFVASMAIGTVFTNVMRRRFSTDEWHTLLLDATALVDRPWWKR